jgi:hypothetical protein
MAESCFEATLELLCRDMEDDAAAEARINGTVPNSFRGRNEISIDMGFTRNGSDNVSSGLGQV